MRLIQAAIIAVVLAAGVYGYVHQTVNPKAQVATQIDPEPNCWPSGCPNQR